MFYHPKAVPVLFSILSSITLALILTFGHLVPIGNAQEPANPPDTPLGTAFTYQGFLAYDGQDVDVPCNFIFSLYNTATGGSPIAEPIKRDNVVVRNGYFIVQLDFGLSVINGTKRWLEIAVHCDPNSDGIIVLEPRQELTPAPHALALPGLWTQSYQADGVDASFIPNLIGGYHRNYIAPGAEGATISGGGTANLDVAIDWQYADAVPANVPFHNQVTESFGVIGGGLGNTASLLSTVDGGALNEAHGYGAAIGGGALNAANGLGSVVSGGYANGIESGDYSVIAGGEHNTTAYSYTTISGGAYNVADAIGATIAGGGANTADGLGTTISGGTENVASGTYATIGGGGGTPATIGGGNQATGDLSTVGGGGGNAASGWGATIAGGEYNAAGLNVLPIPIPAQQRSDAYVLDEYTGDYATVSGGGYNGANSYAVVSGGVANQAYGDGSAIGGGGVNTASGFASVIGGGYINFTDGGYAVVGGGEYNTASYTGTTVSGGSYNVASHYWATVSGGANNLANGGGAAIAGGGNNQAGGYGAAIGGGEHNVAGDGLPGIPEALGSYATIPGGYQNSAFGNFSFAAGQGANAIHQGSFVWSDANNQATASTSDNQFIARAAGGFWLGSSGNVDIQADAFIDTDTGAYLSQGGTWTNASDENLKENFSPVQAEAMLSQVAQLPISRWNYIDEGAAIQHIGPTAQDFYAAFGLGSSNTAIATVDADGVAMAAIQALYQRSEEQQQQISELQAQNAELAVRLAALEALIEQGGAQ